MDRIPLPLEKKEAKQLANLFMLEKKKRIIYRLSITF